MSSINVCGHSACVQAFIDAGISMCLEATPRCGNPKCPGWFIGNDSGSFIQRCDECARFGSDDDARHFVEKSVHACQTCGKALTTETRDVLTPALCKDCYDAIPLEAE